MTTKNQTDIRPKKAMILAAGLGKRMRPLTEKTPKPLIIVQGKALLDHGLDALERAGVEETVVNVHYMADQIINHIENSSRDMKITISDETNDLLDSGGGIKKALPMLEGGPFYLLNADSFWIEGFVPNLQRMSETWNSEKMDFLLLLSSMSNAIGFGSKGDFTMAGNGRLKRRREGQVAPFAYAGGAIVNPAVFNSSPEGAFSLNRLFDQSLEKERLFGLRLDGLWLHVGTPEAIREAEDAILRSAA